MSMLRVWISADPGWEVGCYEGAYRRTEGPVVRASLERHEPGPENILEEISIEGTEGKVLVDRARLVRALECYGPDSNQFYCCWPDCGWGGPGELFDKGESKPHSGDCPGREPVR